MRYNSQGASHAMLTGIVVIALAALMTGCPAGGPEPPDEDGPLTEAAKLVPGDVVSNDYFGSSVSICGDYAIVGAPEHGANGAAYLSVRSGTSWSLPVKLPASTTGDYLGRSVSISGTRALVGATGDDDTADDAGAAYIFD